MAHNPVLINIQEFLKQSLEIHGKIRASQIPAIQDSLFASHDVGEIDYMLSGETRYRGRPGLRLVLAGKIKLCCQRCLGELDYLVASNVWFEVVADESAILGDDEMDYLVGSAEFDVGALVEEELLLSLPLAPRHEEGGCIGDAGTIKEQKKNPFQVLEGLKKKQVS